VVKKCGLKLAMTLTAKGDELCDCVKDKKKDEL
jgi:hypothetical protein